MGRLRELMRAAVVELDAIYFCPHGREAPCRKPNRDALRAADYLQLRSELGDDLETARRPTGHHSV